jgi:hypothetical protein
MMKMLLSLLMASLFLVTEGYAQRTPADFGAKAFRCFQHNHVDSLLMLTPSLPELSAFAKDLGIVEGSDAYRSFIKRYPLVIQSFKDKCYQIQRDSLDYKFSWTNAKLDKVETVEKTITPDNVPNKKVVPLTAINIYFSSKGQQYILTFGDLHPYNGIWKPGNNISLTIHYE